MSPETRRWRVEGGNRLESEMSKMCQSALSPFFGSSCFGRERVVIQCVAGAGVGSACPLFLNSRKGSVQADPFSVFPQAVQSSRGQAADAARGAFVTSGELLELTESLLANRRFIG
jgi:hypothetical protein